MYSAVFEEFTERIFTPLGGMVNGVNDRGQVLQLVLN